MFRIWVYIIIPEESVARGLGHQFLRKPPMLDNYFNSRPKLPSIRLLAVSGATLAMWPRIFFTSCRRSPSVVRQFSWRQGLRHLESPCDYREPSPIGDCCGGCEISQRSSIIVVILLAIASPLFLSGCGVSKATPPVGKTEVASANLEIDAGVVFSDRSSYLCVPLSRFGLSSSENIETIVSSCNCVKPSLIRYSDTSTTTADGVLLELTSDEESGDSTPQPIHLGVVVTLTMDSGEARTVTVSFLHSPEVSEVKRKT